MASGRSLKPFGQSCSLTTKPYAWKQFCPSYSRMKPCGKLQGSLMVRRRRRWLMLPRGNLSRKGLCKVPVQVLQGLMVLDKRDKGLTQGLSSKKVGAILIAFTVASLVT